MGKAHLVTSEVQANTVWIDTYNQHDSDSSFGGYKQSGFGRDPGRKAPWKRTPTS